MTDTDQTDKQSMSRVPGSTPQPELRVAHRASSKYAKGQGITPFAVTSGDFMSNFDDNSVPNDELASQNMISEPDEIEDSQASDFSQVKKKNDQRHARNAIYEGGSQGEQDASNPLAFDDATSVPGAEQRLSQTSKRFQKAQSPVHHTPTYMAGNGLDPFDIQITEKDRLQRSLEEYFSQPRCRQNQLKDSAVKVDMNCSVEMDETPQPISEIHIDIDGIDLSAELPSGVKLMQGLTKAIPEGSNDHMANLSPIIQSSDLMMSELQNTTARKSPPEKISERKSWTEAKVVGDQETIETARTENHLVAKKEVHDIEAQSKQQKQQPPKKKKSCKGCLIVLLVLIVLAGAAAAALWFLNPFEEESQEVIVAGTQDKTSDQQSQEESSDVFDESEKLAQTEEDAAKGEDGDDVPENSNTDDQVVQPDQPVETDPVDEGTVVKEEQPTENDQVEAQTVDGSSTADEAVQEESTEPQNNSSDAQPADEASQLDTTATDPIETQTDTASQSQDPSTEPSTVENDPFNKVIEEPYDWGEAMLP